MIDDDALDSRELSPPNNGGTKSRKMRLQKGKNRQRSSNNGASFDEGVLGYENLALDKIYRVSGQ